MAPWFGYRAGRVEHLSGAGVGWERCGMIGKPVYRGLSSSQPLPSRPPTLWQENTPPLSLIRVAARFRGQATCPLSVSSSKRHCSPTKRGVTRRFPRAGFLQTTENMPSGGTQHTIKTEALLENKPSRYFATHIDASLGVLLSPCRRKKKKKKKRVKFARGVYYYFIRAAVPF